MFLLLAGLVAGAVNAVAGGGSLLVFPALLAVGFAPLPANVTNSVAQWPGYLGNVLGVRVELRGQRRRILATGAVGIAGAVVGCVLLLTLPGAVFDAVVPVLVLLASVVLALSPRIKRWIGAPEPGAPDRNAVLLPATFAAAVYGGYFGGALGVILISTLSLLRPRHAGTAQRAEGTAVAGDRLGHRGDLRPRCAGGLARRGPARPRHPASAASSGDGSRAACRSKCCAGRWWCSASPWASTCS